MTSPATTLPAITLVVPLYNEGGIVDANLPILHNYMEGLGEKWEMVVVNDGSADDSPVRAEAFAAKHPKVRVVHHAKNQGLGAALRTGFAASRGDIIVTVDVDLSYSPDHIGRLIEKMRQSGAKLVLASPYMEGGQVSNVPWKRLLLSREANRFLRFASPANIHTFTGMVRAYDRRFINTLSLKSASMEINMEIVYKTMLLHEQIAEIPAHLKWLPAEKKPDGKPKRRSSMQIPWHTLATLFSGFIFRPFIFFMIPGLLIGLFALYVNVWSVIHWWTAYGQVAEYSWFLDRASFAMRDAFMSHPHTFVIGGLATAISLQFLSMGMLSMQNKRYFEEMYHLATAIYRQDINSHEGGGRQ